MYFKDIYQERNEKYQTAYENQIQALKKIRDESRRQSGPYASYFKQTAELLIKVSILLDHLKSLERHPMSLDSLKAENYDRFKEILPRNYDASLANPQVCVDLYGKSAGQILSYVYTKGRSCFAYAYDNKIFRISSVYDLFINAYEALNEHDVTALRAVVREFAKDDITFGSETYAKETMGAQNERLTKIVVESDLSAPNYLYDYGIYITDHELKTFEFMKAYPQDKIEKLAQTIVKAYIDGFRRDGKDISLRHNVRIVAVAGQEKLTRRIIEVLNDNKLNGFVAEMTATDVNHQYGYDHKFDLALYLDRDMADFHMKSRKDAMEIEKEILGDYSGILYVEKFGEEPFSPKSNTARVTLNDDQQSLYQELANHVRITTEGYIPEKERSFNIVAFPTPEIGDQFEAIFEDTALINMLNSDEYEEVQKHIIDALDLGNQVHVLGKDGNETDIVVALQELENPTKQTNFVNCVADVNIPVGEVFTSPVLKGTNGLLHLKKVYLDGFNYNDLKLKFVDGYVKEYTCANFDNEEENKKYIKENLLFPHDTLPLGEFAIGTNTLAYVIAEKYDITDKLPILIVEKMGPHFAVGDTCFSFAEDTPVFNEIDGKEIIARDNEHSIIRKEDINKAYTNCHTDITLPYDGLAKISVMKNDGDEVMIIENGRFVLKGTELLNEPFEK